MRHFTLPVLKCEQTTHLRLQYEVLRGQTCRMYSHVIFTAKATVGIVNRDMKVSKRPSVSELLHVKCLEVRVTQLPMDLPVQQHIVTEQQFFRALSIHFASRNLL